MQFEPLSKAPRLMDSNPAKPSWIRLASSNVLVATSIFLFAFVGSSLWFGFSLTGGRIVLFSLALGHMAAIASLPAHLILACFTRGRHFLHLFFVVLVLASFALTPWTSELHRALRRHQFIEHERLAYEAMVQKVIANKTVLRSNLRAINGLVQRNYGASAMTNEDGSVTILFPGSESGPRHGYLYHSGRLLNAMPWDDPDAHFLHLTNGWYEY